MKKAYHILANRPKVTISLTRDSVAAGDDCDAPHASEIEINSFTDPVVLSQQIASQYLPNISGQNHYWTAEFNEIRIAQVGPNVSRELVRLVSYENTNRMHFSYHSAIN
jgi:hypothetical protein